MTERVTDRLSLCITLLHWELLTCNVVDSQLYCSFLLCPTGSITDLSMAPNLVCLDLSGLSRSHFIYHAYIYIQYTVYSSVLCWVLASLSCCSFSSSNFITRPHLHKLVINIFMLCIRCCCCRCWFWMLVSLSLGVHSSVLVYHYANCIRSLMMPSKSNVLF